MRESGIFDHPILTVVNFAVARWADGAYKSRMICAAIGQPGRMVRLQIGTSI
jgi:hypothetical protein